MPTTDTRPTESEFMARYDALPLEKQREFYLTAERLRRSPEALEAKGWRAWYAEIFGQAFVDALDSAETDDKHHSEAIEWHWITRTALIKLELSERNYRKQFEAGVISRDEFNARIAEISAARPALMAYFTIWARGNLKTTIARRVIVCDACLCTTAGVGGYALVIGGTKGKVGRTASSVEALLRSEKVRKYYPKLSEVKRSQKGTSKGWRADFLNTEAGYVFDFAGLDEGMAGANEEDIRPTFIVPDDLDQRSDSPVIAESNFTTFTTEILPMRQWNTVVWWAQNLISRYSCMYRIWKQQARVLTNRVFTNPVPAVRNLVTEARTVGNLVKDVYVSGKPTSKLWDVRRIQDEIDTMGLPAFLKECQHEVEQDREGLALQNYDDSVHVISKSEFAKIFGTREIPQRWFKYVFNDWARTKTAFHANVAGIVTVSSQNEPLPGCVFVFEPMSFKAGASPEDVAIRLLTAISPTVKGTSFTWRDLVQTTLQGVNLEYLIQNETELITKRRELLAKVIPQYVAPILRKQNYQTFRGSHEQSKTGALSVYRNVFGLPFVGVNPGGDGGLDDIDLLLKVDYSLPHRVRPNAKGFTNFFIVVEDEKLPYNETLTPDDLHDSDLLRYQFKNYRFRDPYLTVKGQHEGELLKMNDDFPNGLMMLFHDKCVQAAPLTHEELITEHIPVQHRVETMLKSSPNGVSLTPEQELTAVLNRKFAEQRITPRVQSFDDYGQPIG